MLAELCERHRAGLCTLEVAAQFGDLGSRHGFKRGRYHVLYLRRATAPPPIALRAPRPRPHGTC